jgi:hypothetical protein
MVKIFFFNFNSKINKQLYLSETERIEVLMMIGYGDRKLCWCDDTFDDTQKMKRSLCDTVLN